MARNVLRRGVLGGVLLAAVSALAGLTPAVGAVGPADWPAFMNGPSHTSINKAQTAITPANAASLTMKWHFVGDQPTMKGQPKPAYNASPTVADGAVYIGSRTGWFYKLNETTGKVLAKTFLGFQPGLTCTAGGIIATATVAKDPKDGQDTVYVGAPDGFLYALRASDLSRKWRSVIAIPSKTISDYFQWSSPTVIGGKIYIGVSSHCDHPLIRGGVIGYNQATGKVFARYFDVPKGVVGGSVWSSVAAGTKYVFATTGNGATGASPPERHDRDGRAAGRQSCEGGEVPAAAVAAGLRRRLRRIAGALRVAGRRMQQERPVLRAAHAEHEARLGAPGRLEPRQHRPGDVHRRGGVRRLVPVRGGDRDLDQRQDLRGLDPPA